VVSYSAHFVYRQSSPTGKQDDPAENTSSPYLRRWASVVRTVRATRSERSLSCGRAEDDTVVICTYVMFVMV
jgi:hypothetical protein